MKGVFTQIKYLAQGVLLREAKMTGMVVGLPISTEHRKQIRLGSSADLTAATATALPLIEIFGDNPAFDYRALDVVHAVRMWVMKPGGLQSTATEMLLDSQPLSITKGNYGVAGESLFSCNPVKYRTTVGPDGTTPITCTSESATGHVSTVTFSAVVTDIAIGDTISNSTDIGKVTSIREVNSATEADVYWKDTINGPVGSMTAYVLYYDYTADPVTGNARGYVMYFDSVVYRTSVYGVMTMAQVEDITALFGENSISNPLSNLAMGAFLFMGANGFKDKVKICALDLREVDSLEDLTPEDLMGGNGMLPWSSAITKVDAHKDTYYLTTMTSDETIQDMWIAYVNTSADLYRQREKRYYLPKNVLVMDGVEDKMADSFGNGKYGDNDYEAGRQYDKGYLDGDDAVPIDKDASVEIALSVPVAYNNERLTFIGCEWATIDDINIDGYYVSAIIAGWRSSMAKAYVADDMKVPLITSIPSANSFYTEDDLDDLSNAGWYMLYQEMPAKPVVCYMQKTTAYDVVEKGEESFIVALDSAMRDIRETIAPYTKGGLDNRISATNPDSPVTVRYLNKLNAAISGVRYQYTVVDEVFASMEIISVKASEMKRTATEIKVKFSHYYPSREIYVTGYVE